MEVLEKAVEQRIEGTQVEERADNKMWLVRYLEVRLCCCVFTCVGYGTHPVNAICAMSFSVNPDILGD
jgi:hypothetical protein